MPAGCPRGKATGWGRETPMLRLLKFGVETMGVAREGFHFQDSRVPARLKELTFSKFFCESARFSQKFSRNSGRIYSRRVAIRQEFRNCCEGIPVDIPAPAVNTRRQAGQRHSGIYIYTNICLCITDQHTKSECYDTRSHNNIEKTT